MLRKSGQSLTEYSICLAVVLIALITMNFYVKRGLQGRYKDLADYTMAKAHALRQYEPYYKGPLSEYDNTTGKKIIGNMSSGGNLIRNLPSLNNYMGVEGVSNPETEDTIKNGLP